MRYVLAMLALLMLTSCASLRKVETVYLPPRIDCAANEGPKAEQPTEPGLKGTVPEWQLYAWGWQSYAEGVLLQRVETARCMSVMREAGIIK